MAQLVVRNLEEDVKARLQRRASRSGHSMEEEIRAILRNAVLDEAREGEPLGSKLARRFAGLGLDQDFSENKGQAPRPAQFDR